MGKEKPNKEKIKMFREIDPTRTATSMAKELNITRERVRQILNDLGLPTAFLKPQRICDNEGCNNKLKGMMLLKRVLVNVLKLIV